MSENRFEAAFLAGDKNEPFRISINRDGQWFYNQQEITHQGVLRYFSQHLERNSQGQHFLVLNRERCLVYVEDTPLLISIISYSHNSQESFKLILNDGSEEMLMVDTLNIDAQDNIYCWVRNKTLEAKFKKNSYIELAKYLHYDEIIARFYLEQNGKRWYLNKREGNDHRVL